MTKLNEKRDELAAQEDMKAFVNPQITFKRGFDAAIEELKKQIDDKIQEAFTTRETGPWEKLREIRRILNNQEGK